MELLNTKPRIIYVGVESFNDSLRTFGGKSVQYNWKPMAGGNKRMIHLLNELAKHEEIDEMNMMVVERFRDAQSFLVDVVEKNVVSTLMKGGHVVITVGGGGIPVISKDGRLIGTPAVIDKDFASAKLAELICADMLVILTAVDRVAINWGKPNQKSLEEMSVAEAEQYCREGHFAPGSMLPKVEAAMSIARVGGTAIIASLQNAAAALRGESGTRVHA